MNLRKKTVCLTGLAWIAGMTGLCLLAPRQDVWAARRISSGQAEFAVRDAEGEFCRAMRHWH